MAQTAGELAAYEMLAGTSVLGGSGPRPGSGMRRGTLWYWQGEAPEFSPTFRRGSRAWPLALEIVRRRLMAAGFAAPEAGLAWQMHHGDMLAGGRGEVFTAA